MLHWLPATQLVSPPKTVYYASITSAHNPGLKFGNIIKTISVSLHTAVAKCVLTTRNLPSISLPYIPEWLTSSTINLESNYCTGSSIRLLLLLWLMMKMRVKSIVA
jgi:uncharacterized protein YjaZ